MDGGTQKSKKNNTNSSRRKFLSQTAVAGGISVGIAGCVSNENNEGATTDVELGVGSKNFTEQVLLGKITVELLRQNTNATVVDNTNFGNTQECRDGLVDRDFHVFWEYIGTAWFFWPPVKEASLGSPDKAYENVTEHVTANYDLTTLSMTTFENSFGLFATPERIEETGITTISDLKNHVNNGGYDITIALEDEFYRREDGWQGLTNHYGFEETALESWETEDSIIVIDPGLGYDMVEQGTADIGLGYTTNAQLSAYDLQLLDDDEDFWPPYNVFPTVTDTKANDVIVSELERLPDAFDDATEMQELNKRVDIDGEEPSAVATDVLETKNLV